MVVEQRNPLVGLFRRGRVGCTGAAEGTKRLLPQLPTASDKGV